MPDVKTIIFSDLITRDAAAHLLIDDQLKAIAARGGARGKEEKEEEDRLKELQPLAKAVVDPLFQAVRFSFKTSVTNRMSVTNHTAGKLKITSNDDDDWVRFAFVAGILGKSGVAPPRVTKQGTGVATDKTDRAYGPFVRAFYRALGDLDAQFDLAKLVLPILQTEGDPDGTGALKGHVDTQEFADVMSFLREKHVTEDEPQLNRRVNEALDHVQRKRIDPPIEELSIALPDFNLSTEYQIQEKNVEAFGPMICAAMLDELKAFEVVDKLVEFSQAGLLTTTLTEAGSMLYDYWKQTPTRMSDGERRNFYALTMGIPGGSVNGSANRDFNDLWIRFVSSVSQLVRQRSTDFLLRANIPSSLNQQQVRKSARDLALNLSSHGYGMVSFAARDLQIQIKKMIDLLQHEEIKNAYGAKDMWQVIDQVASLELGGARNSARYRTLATCGAIITKWLAQNVRKYNSATSAERVINVDDVIAQFPKSAGANATNFPTDYDLVNACELWIADTAVSEDGVKDYSQPRESPAMTSRPVQIPAIAKEILSQSLPPGLGFGVNRR